MTQYFSTKNNPESFIKYGKYEMRLIDKMRIEAGFMTKAKVKWWGGSSFAHPYLWKEDKADAEYKENWGDPRVVKKEIRIENQNKQPIIKKSGPKIG